MKWLTLLIGSLLGVLIREMFTFLGVKLTLKYGQEIIKKAIAEKPISEFTDLINKYRFLLSKIEVVINGNRRICF